VLEQNKNLVLRLYVQPGAAKTQISGQFGEGPDLRLKLRISAPPVEGAANLAVQEFLAKRLGLKLRQVVLLRGEKSRAKDFQVPNEDGNDLFQALQQMAVPGGR